MSRKQRDNQDAPKRKLSKRERRTRIIIYVMIVTMILSLFTYGASFI